MKKTKKISVEKSRGNVFADLGFADAEELLVKSELVRQICVVIRKRHLTQVQAAKILDIDQPKISALMRGRLQGFSTDRLIRFLNALGRDIDIIVKPKSRSRKRARTHITTTRKSHSRSLVFREDGEPRP
jgi:predicted XRE-type DNA-binding protein